MKTEDQYSGAQQETGTSLYCKNVLSKRDAWSGSRDAKQ